MSQKHLVFGAVVLLLLLTIVPASGIGVLKIEVPQTAMVGEEVEIKVTDSITNSPVQGVTVYVNGVEIGKTGENGKIGYVFDSPGIYVIGASKFGYTPAVSLSLTVRESPIHEKPPEGTPTPEKTPKVEEYRGLVFKGDLINEFIIRGSMDPIPMKELGVSKLIEKVRGVKPISPIAFFTDGVHYLVLYGDINVERSGYYEIKGYSLNSEVKFKDKSWTLFEVEEIRRLEPEEVSAEGLVSNPASYAGKEIVVSGPFREISFKIDSLNSPICIGSVSTAPIEFNSFAREILDKGREFLKNPDRNSIENITRFAGVSTFRFQNGFLGDNVITQAYWKAVNAEIKGLVIPANLAGVLLPGYIDKFISERGMILMVEEVEMHSERANLDDILSNPEEYYGKVVELRDIYNLAEDISIRDAISLAFPPARTFPLDAYFEPMTILNIPPDGFILGFGVTGFKQAYGGITDLVHFDGKYTVKGVVVSASMVNNTLPNKPAIIVFERYRQFENKSLPIDQAKEIIKAFNMIKNVALGLNPQIQKHTPEKSAVNKTKEMNLQSLNLSIAPSTITASPGESVNLKIKVEWKPKDWKGKASIKIVLSAAGFKKEYELPGIILENPPIENEFKYTLPDNLPPLTYEAKIVVQAGGKIAEENVKINVKAGKTPGFEVIGGLIALLGSFMLRKRWS